MKRRVPWEEEDGEESSSSDESSNSDTDTDGDKTKQKKSQGKFGKRTSGAIDFDSLKKHGYKGGLSVLNVPPPKDDKPPEDWSWSTGKEHREVVKEESFQERQKTRAAGAGELLVQVAKNVNVQTSAKDKKKDLSFAQKEKRKRDIGQTSRGKNYVEEEKRLLRESGIYSSFDT